MPLRPEAPGGAIRLRDRYADPSKSYYKVTDEELLNVEGDMRVEGDVRLAGGNLDFRKYDGTDQKTPLKLVRYGDALKPSGQGGGRDDRENPMNLHSTPSSNSE